MRLLTKTFYEELEKSLEDDRPDLTDEEMTSAVLGIVDQLVPVMRESLKDNAPAMLAEQRKAHNQFSERNVTRWQAGFDALETLIVSCTEAGELYNDENRPEAADSGDAVFEICVRLHARGCLIAREIVCLLRNGFADGALARWRALYEVAVTARFVADHGPDCACRYHAHQIVDSWNGAKSHQKAEDRLQEKGLDDYSLRELRQQYDDVIETYGKSFKQQYGWATAALQKDKVYFTDLERDVELDHWRPYYKWACQAVHAGAKALYHSLGFPRGPHDGLLAGPSDAGMTNPAHQTAISLAQLTTTLLTLKPNLDDLVLARIIDLMQEDVGAEFLSADSTGP